MEFATVETDTPDSKVYRPNCISGEVDPQTYYNDLYKTVIQKVKSNNVRILDISEIFNLVVQDKVLIGQFCEFLTEFAGVLNDNTSLLYLAFSANNLGYFETFLMPILQALQNHSSLLALDMSRNELPNSRNMVEALQQFITTNSHVNFINLSGNANIDFGEDLLESINQNSSLIGVCSSDEPYDSDKPQIRKQVTAANMKFLSFDCFYSDHDKLDKDSHVDVEEEEAPEETNPSLLELLELLQIHKIEPTPETSPLIAALKLAIGSVSEEERAAPRATP